MRVGTSPPSPRSGNDEQRRIGPTVMSLTAGAGSIVRREVAQRNLWGFVVCLLAVESPGMNGTPTTLGGEMVSEVVGGSPEMPAQGRRVATIRTVVCAISTA